MPMMAIFARRHTRVMQRELHAPPRCVAGRLTLKPKSPSANEAKPLGFAAPRKHHKGQKAWTCTAAFAAP
eukprot:12916362-Prorocentrum_lima.AAC.1